MITKALEQLITMAILLHNDAHDGEFLQCTEHDCYELRVDLLDLAETELRLWAMRQPQAVAS